jgi:hypothetical protein
MYSAFHLVGLDLACKKRYNWDYPESKQLPILNHFDVRSRIVQYRTLSMRLAKSGQKNKDIT